ncbi:hypothetical protein GQR60_09795 [Labilibaculum sp. A4]|uniref:hypothetical protein n=1 Tax=Labilibaculum euxinus TaxID=2686357 RepID=UPI000F620BE3|nr:hypothetical protein [Labilibaculum euxinus]MDQ1771479.1 hypothetical protein [Labilibaculum euxinus]MWN76633.1 hypothetical protein [Labilibaculum euxinus]
MKLFKPFVNLTKSASTGVYTINSVVSLPKDYALSSIEQGLIEIDGKKVWSVTATVTTNGSLETDIVEFAVPIKQGPTDEIKKVNMIVKQALSGDSSVGNPVEENRTDVDYDDAETTNP